MATRAFPDTELQTLMGYEPQPGHKVLSAYLEIDQSRPANLNHGFIRNAKELLRSSEQAVREESERAAWDGNCKKLLAFLAGLDIQGRTLIVFSDVSKNFFWTRELHILIPPQVRWDEKPCLRPLIEAIDEFERYAVALVDRERARLFTVYLGQIEEQRDVLSDEKRKHFKKTGRDTVQSQPNFQRHEDEHAQQHLKEVAGALERLASGNGFDRLILAGPHETTNELRGLLPKKVQALVAREMPLPIDASEHVVLKETMRVEEELERENEVRLVEQLITAGSKANQAVLGLEDTLEAMRRGSLMRLIYVFDLSIPGSQCTNCGSLFEGRPDACAYCSASLKPVTDIVARLADWVVDSGGQAENVRGPAADRLRPAGAIGAFLRF